MKPEFKELLDKWEHWIKYYQDIESDDIDTYDKVVAQAVSSTYNRASLDLKKVLESQVPDFIKNSLPLTKEESKQLHDVMWKQAKRLK